MSKGVFFCLRIQIFYLYKKERAIFFFQKWQSPQKEVQVT